MKTIDFARCALALLLAAPLAAQTEEAQSASEEPAATYEDVLFVEDSLPYVPESSTIGIRPSTAAAIAGSASIVEIAPST